MTISSIHTVLLQATYLLYIITDPPSKHQLPPDSYLSTDSAATSDTIEPRCLFLKEAALSPLFPNIPTTNHSTEEHYTQQQQVNPLASRRSPIQRLADLHLPLHTNKIRDQEQQRLQQHLPGYIIPTGGLRHLYSSSGQLRLLRDGKVMKKVGSCPTVYLVDEKKMILHDI